MVGGWMFLLVPAHPGSQGQRAVKRLLLFQEINSFRWYNDTVKIHQSQPNIYTLRYNCMVVNDEFLTSLLLLYWYLVAGGGWRQHLVRHQTVITIAGRRRGGPSAAAAAARSHVGVFRRSHPTRSPSSRLVSYRPTAQPAATAPRAASSRPSSHKRVPANNRIIIVIKAADAARLSTPAHNLIDSTAETTRNHSRDCKPPRRLTRLRP